MPMTDHEMRLYIKVRDYIGDNLGAAKFDDIVKCVGEHRVVDREDFFEWLMRHGFRVKR
jgi:hypothetical protein